RGWPPGCACRPKMRGSSSGKPAGRPPATGPDGRRRRPVHLSGARRHAWSGRRFGLLSGCLVRDDRGAFVFRFAQPSTLPSIVCKLSVLQDSLNTNRGAIFITRGPREDVTFAFDIRLLY